MTGRKWLPFLALAVASLLLGLLLGIQLGAQRDDSQTADNAGWEVVVADLIDSNARLREGIESLQAELVALNDVERGGAMLQSLVDEVNQMRVANGLIEVSGPGVEVVVTGPISVLDLHDLINELRNTGAEGLALNSRRLVTWTAISTDGVQVTVDGRPVDAPYVLEAIGEPHTLEVALKRPGGLVSLLQQAHAGVTIKVQQRAKLTLPVYDQPLRFVYAEAVQ